MRCLFCGKELALLKRLRGGGEFCSDAHRQSYQKEYNQLALSRLLQAKPNADAPLIKPLVPSQPDPPPPPTVQETPTRAQFEPEPALSAVAVLESDALESDASAAVSYDHDVTQDDSDPGYAGFVNDFYDPAKAPVEYFGNLELGRMVAGSPELPSFGAAAGASPTGGQWATASSLEIELSFPPRDYNGSPAQLEPEQRELGRSAPVFGLHLATANDSIPEGSAKAMSFVASPAPPQSLADPWYGLPREFTAGGTQLGDLGRLNFAVMGFDTEEAPPLHSPTRQAHETETFVPREPELAQPVRLATFVEPVHIEASFLESRAEPNPIPTVMQPPAAAESPAVPATARQIPEMGIKPLAVTLHGLAAVRGKAKPIFTSPLPPVFEVRVPRPTCLPLRPAIVFGAAPVVPEQKTEPKEARKKVSAKASPVPEVSPGKDAVVETVVQTPAPEKPKESPQIQSEPAPQFDLGLPSLNLPATSNPWVNLPIAAKIGVAAGVLAVIGGLIYLMSSGHAGTSPVQKEVVTVAALPIPDAGWIENWISDAQNSKRERRVTLLRASLPLSDYRVEFKAEIAEKAIGWVFRGKNPKNYYAARLETVDPGLEPTVALVHYAVIDGKDQEHTQKVLPMKLRSDTMYKIRFEAVGNRFTAWVQDQKIDEWTDDRIPSGGVGLLSERDGRTAVQGSVNVVQLVATN